MHCGVENLNFNMSNKKRQIKLPPRILVFNKTLKVLKLENIQMRDFDQVDFPCIKTIHLDKITFISQIYCQVSIRMSCSGRFVYKITCIKVVACSDGKLNPLPNLVNVRICYDLNIPMTLLCKAKVLQVVQV